MFLIPVARGRSCRPALSGNPLNAQPIVASRKRKSIHRKYLGGVEIFEDVGAKALLPHLEETPCAIELSLTAKPDPAHSNAVHPMRLSLLARQSASGLNKNPIEHSLSRVLLLNTLPI